MIHFAANPPSKLWPKGIAACSHAEWVGSCALAERKASSWRKESCVEAIEIRPSPNLRAATAGRPQVDTTDAGQYDELARTASGDAAAAARAR